VSERGNCKEGLFYIRKESKMKKYLFIMVVTAMMATPTLSTTLTKEILYLYEKDPSDWSIVPDGVWAYMEYRPAYPTFAFWFGAFGLEPSTDYTLIYYPDPWPGEGLICLGSGTTDSYGRLHICETPNTGDLPKEDDDNYPTGAKIWLVLSSDVDCTSDPTKMIAWQPERYLFEGNLVTYEDTKDTLDLLDSGSNKKGQLCYDPSGTEFCFKLCASGLDRGKEYTLVYILDLSAGPPWDVVCLVSRKTDSCGRISINACIELDQDLIDAQVGLLPSDEVDCSSGQIPAVPTDYLIADGTINYNDTEVP
jgi:hypothetical protein